MDMEKLKNNRLDEEQLDQVAGGGWGWNDFHDEAVYESCGVKCSWTKDPFTKDKFYYKGQQISGNEAGAIVFYTLNHKNKNGNPMQPKSIEDALAYKSQRGDAAYEDFCDAING